MREHPTTWVKVNALVDKGIAELVVLLNEVEGLQTLESCQGGSPANPDEERPAYVFFLFKDWETISRFAFDVVSPAVAKLDADTTVMVEAFNDSDPMGRIQIRPPAAIPIVAAALREAICHKSLCSCGRTRKAPRNSPGHHPHLPPPPSCGARATF